MHQNSLSKYFTEFEIDPVDGLNFLQDYGVISDLCVEVKDVSEVDCAAAIGFISEKGNHLKGRLL